MLLMAVAYGDDVCNVFWMIKLTLVDRFFFLEIFLTVLLA